MGTSGHILIKWLKTNGIQKEMSEVMKRIPNIALTSSQLDEIVELWSFDREGGEAIICESGKHNSLYKIFYDIYTKEVVPLSDNKFKKILALHKMNLEHSVKILSTISVDGQLFGYEMSYDPLDIALNRTMLNRKQIIEVLKQSSEILKYYSRHDIIYGDVKSNNILINRKTGKVTFCDMDNVQISSFSIDLKGIELRHFLDQYGRIDAKADSYMHNLLTLQQFGFPNQYTTMEGVIMTLESGVIPEDIFTEEGKEILLSMQEPKNFNGNMPYNM